MTKPQKIEGGCQHDFLGVSTSFYGTGYVTGAIRSCVKCGYIDKLWKRSEKLTDIGTDKEYKEIKILFNNL